MECPYCKSQNRDGVRFCANCGKAQVAAAPLSVPGANAGNTHARSLTPGARLQGGRYEIKRVLGQGGMGAALLAVDNRLDGKLVVIKELLSENTDPNRVQDDVRNFKREVAMLAHIDHPLVPNVTDHFQEGPRYFMVQEYVEGETLEEYIDRLQQPMNERDVLVSASEILDVLEHLSLQTPPVVHRDIKPANIIIGTKDRRSHLVDFGIARADEAKNAQRKQTSALGTPGYAPPEQYQGNADPRSDLYALAATLHHLLTNRDPRNYPPFIYPPVRTLNSQLSPDIEHVLTHALNNDINGRYQSATAMKRNIDDILQKRFGVSTWSNSYTLGSSSFTGTIPANKTTPPVGTVTATTPAYLGSPQVQPVHSVSATQTQPVNVPVQHSPPRRRIGLLALLLGLLLLLLVSGGVFAAFSLLSERQTNATSTPTVTTSVRNGIGVTKIGSDEIGISDGSYVFDSGRINASLKGQAADKLKGNTGDTSGVIAILSSALEQEPNDAEAHIYLEDQRVLSSGSPYVTLVVGTMLSSDNIGVGRDNLQGAYVAQKEYNDGSKLANGYKVRLLIANSGSKASYSQTVAQQIVQLAQSDNTFVGVMGWPFSSRSLDAVKVLGKAGIPMVSQTSSSDELTAISRYFFRVAPSNNIQGVAGAKYAEQTLNANTAALFVDPADTYSQSLASDFRTQFQKDGKRIVIKEEYTIGKTGNFALLLQDALKYNPDIIYFSGYAADISTLLTNLPAGNGIKVMGGDALYELNGYQSSARAGFTHLRFTAFAYPDQWDVLGQAAKKPSFFADYSAAFSPNKTRVGYGYTRPDNDAMLSYDATLALLLASNSALNRDKAAPESVRQALTTVAFQGVSGQVAFDPNGNPVNKAIVILSVDSLGQIRMELPVQGQFFQ